MTLAELLAQWMPTQRWFAGKGLDVVGVEIEQVTELAVQDGLRLLHVIARMVHAGDGGGGPLPGAAGGAHRAGAGS